MSKFVKVLLYISIAAIISGCVMLVIAFSSGYVIRKGERYSFDESYEGVKAITIDVQYADVSIREGDSFSIDARNLLVDSEFTSQVSDGIWKISEKATNVVKVFGLKLPLLTAYGDKYSPDIDITVPKGFEADKLIFNISAGRLQGENIRARTGSFSVDAGELLVDGLVIPEGSDYNIGTGHLVISDLEAEDITIKCGVGDVELEGIVTGKNKVDCSIGRVKLELDAYEDDYSYEAETVLGSIYINGRSYHGAMREREFDGGNLGFFNLECEIGNISIDFR
jgi:hypothetical protein